MDSVFVKRDEHDDALEGVAYALGGAFIGALGDNLLRLSYVKERERDDMRPLIARPLWVAGFACSVSCTRLAIVCGAWASMREEVNTFTHARYARSEPPRAVTYFQHSSSLKQRLSCTDHPRLVLQMYGDGTCKCGDNSVAPSCTMSSQREFCGSLVRFAGAPHLPPRSFPLQTLVIPFAATHVGFAILFAQLLVGERLTAHDVAGSVLVAAGIVIVGIKDP